MGLFRKTKSRGPSSLPDEQIDIPTQSQKKSKKKWFSKKNKSNKHSEEYDDQVPLKAVDTIEKQQYPKQQLVNNAVVSEERGDTPLLNQYNNTSDMNNNDYEDASIGDIPRSISTPSRDMGNELPPLPATPNDLAQCCGMNNIMNTTGYGVEEDSIGSPCDAMFKKNQQQKQQQQQQKQVVDKLRTLTIVPTDEANDEHNKIKNQATIDKLQSIITPEATPSIDHLTYYIQALSSSISPNPSGDLPARALRSLFTLSELSTNKQQRIDMVRGSPNDEEKELSLIPALLNFLQRCPRDSSEQYLTLLVLNNLSIPNENKRTIALQYDGVATLGKLLCEDPGCHLLVIIIVNLTFGDEALNRDILESKGTGEDGEGSGVQLVESISYALLLATLTTEQLATLGPVPLSNEEGEPYSPSKLLSLLFTMLESKLQLKYHRSHLKGNHENDNLMLLPPISLGDNEEEYPFAETARWCLGALKNLTRSSKLSPTSVTSSNDELKVGVHATKDTAASTVASQAILDSGILTLLLRIIKNKNYDDAGTVYNWEANSAQDAALYTLLHMSSVPEIREVLRLDYECVEVLTGILNYGKAIVGEKTLVKDEEGESMGQLSLQCLKARLALSYLVLGQENSSAKFKYGPSTIIAEHEAHSLIELLSHCLHGRAKEGTGGYSSATFSLKFVLYGIVCILSEPANRKLFASTGNASRLNTLLLKSISLTILNSDLMDSEAAEYALQSIYHMTLYGLNEDELGYSITCGQAIFLPANLGDDGHDFEAKGVVTRVLRSYLSSQDNEITLKARNAANQIMFRLNYLRFDGCVADLAYTGKTYPAKSDYELDSKVFSVINMLHDIERKGEKPEEHIFTRSIVRKEKDGGESKVYSNVLAAAEELALSITSKQDDKSSPISQEPLDIIAVANNITYYADGLDIYYGYTFKWGDGRGDLIERIYSAAETEDQEGFPVVVEKVEGLAVAVEDQPEPQRKGCFGDVFNRMKLHSKVVDENEPYSIFGLRCAALRCGSGKGSASTVVLED